MSSQLEIAIRRASQYVGKGRERWKDICPTAHQQLNTKQDDEIVNEVRRGREIRNSKKIAMNTNNEQTKLNGKVMIEQFLNAKRTFKMSYS